MEVGEGGRCGEKESGVLSIGVERGKGSLCLPWNLGIPGFQSTQR